MIFVIGYSYYRKVVSHSLHYAYIKCTGTCMCIQLCLCKHMILV